MALAVILLLGFLPEIERICRIAADGRIVIGGDVFPHIIPGSVARLREGGEAGFAVRPGVRKAQRCFGGALHGDRLKIIVVGKFTRIHIHTAGIRLIPVPGVVTGAERIHHGKNGTRLRLVVFHREIDGKDVPRRKGGNAARHREHEAQQKGHQFPGFLFHIFFPFP